MDMKDRGGVSGGQPARGGAAKVGAGDQEAAADPIAGAAADSAAGVAASGPVAGAGSSLSPEREIDELKFLIGTACSRLINLLIDSRADPATLAAEAEFVSVRTGRLAELLAQQSSTRPQ